MLPKLIVLRLCLTILLAVGLCGTAIAATEDSLTIYEASIDRSCQQDSDCTVKDVHNCCGYYPACVNKAAVTDAARVQRLCAESSLAGVCGFPDISDCACLKGACQPGSAESGKSPPVAQ